MAQQTIINGESGFLTRSALNANFDELYAAMFPVSTVVGYAGSTAPSGWALCFGQSVLRAGTYAALFAVIGTQYGSVDGTHFSLPDLRGRVEAGKDNMGGTSANRLTGLSGGVDGDVLGAGGGEESHVLTVAELASHHHDFTAALSNSQSLGGPQLDTYATSETEQTGDAGGDDAHNNVQPTLILNKIIKI